MTLDDALTVLREHRADLRREHVVRAGVFGSVARGDQHPDSDVDVLIEFDPEARVTLFGYVGVKHFVQSLFATRADVIERDSLSKYIREVVEREVVYAF